MNPYYIEYIRCGGKPMSDNDSGWDYMQWINDRWRDYGAAIDAPIRSTGGYAFTPDERLAFAEWLTSYQPNES